MALVGVQCADNLLAKTYGIMPCLGRAIVCVQQPRCTGNKALLMGCAGNTIFFMCCLAGLDVTDTGCVTLSCLAANTGHSLFVHSYNVLPCVQPAAVCAHAAGPPSPSPSPSPSPRPRSATLLQLLAITSCIRLMA
jgi:hypothetical protein